MTRPIASVQSRHTQLPLLCRILLVLSLCSSLVGCSLVSNPWRSSNAEQRAWLTDGSLAISRPLPPISTTSLARSRMKPLDMPNSVRPSTTVLRLNRAAGKLSIEGPDTTPMVFNVQVASSMRPGRYTVALKQTSPLWYAPTSYFTHRSLAVPAEGSRARFKRGALGTQALFLNEQTPIHSGPVGIPEIGGIRLNSRDMNDIFQAVSVGTVVDVR